MTGALALVAALTISSQIQTHPAGLDSIGPSRGRSLRTAPIMDKLYQQANKPALDFNFARFKDLHDDATGKTSLVTFSRSAAQSPGTYVGADGLIHDAAVNLALYSEQFNGPSWSLRVRVIVSDNQAIAPDGKQTADKFIPTVDNDSHVLNQAKAGAVAGRYTASCFFKAGEYGFGVLRISTNSFANLYSVVVNLSDGSVTDSSITGSPNGSHSVESVGDGWYRVSVSADHTSGDAYITPSASNVALPSSYNSSLPSFAGDGTSGIYIWGAQLEEGSTATPYIKTTSQALAAPRFDHDPVTGESLGLLVEEQRANLLLHSENFGASSWTALSTTRDNDVSVSPKGSFTADRFTTTVANNVFVTGNRIYSSSSSSGTRSVYAKADSSSEIIMRLNGTNSSRVIFDLLAGTLDSSLAGPTLLSASITDVGNGWYRCSVSDSGSDFLMVAVHNEIGSVLLWGAQLETGSFPSSYIPTTGSSQTRYADIAAVQDEDFATTNLLAYSESFDVGWIRIGTNAFGGGSVVNAAVSPDGQTTADLITEDTSTGRHIIYLNTDAGTKTASVYMKEAGRRYVGLVVHQATSYKTSIVDLRTATVTDNDGVQPITISDVGNGWRRVSVSGAPAAGSLVVALSDVDNNDGTLVIGSPSYAGDGTSGIYLWGASLTATEYPVAYTTTRNLLSDSQDFERSTWVKSNASVEDDAIQAPDGTLTADKPSNTATSASQVTQQNVTVGSGASTYSVYAKAGSIDFVSLRTSAFDADITSTFNISTGTVQSQGSGHTASITDAGNGWFRVAVQFSTSSDLVGNIHAYLNADGGSIFGPNLGSSGSSYIYLWGAQLEPGTTATDYVRTVDTVGKAYGFYEPTEGTVLGVQARAANTDNAVFAMLYDGTSSNRVELRSYQAGNARFLIVSGGSTQMDQGLGGPVNPIGSPNYHALSYKYNDSNVSINGNIGTQDTSVVVPIVDRLELRKATFAVEYNGHIKRLTYWPVRQSDSTLQVITQ